MSSYKTLLDQYKNEYEQIQIELNNLSSVKASVKDFDKMQSEFTVELQKLQKLIDLKENQIQTIENYIDKYQPIRVQSQISELLNEIFSGKEKELLTEVEGKKFEDLHTLLLMDNGVANLMEQMNNINKDLEQIMELEVEDDLGL